MLTQKLLAFASVGAEWVLWLLLGLSLASVAVMIERALFFVTRRLADTDAVSRLLLAGDYPGALAAVEGRAGMEAEVVRAAAAHAAKGAASVAEVVAGQVERSRLEYERGLAFLGTLGNNAPFIGLFGTVLGVIRAFADLALHPGAAGGATVMAGIADALVATAVGLFVAIPAVVMFNLYQRWLRRAAQRSAVLGHAAAAHLEAREA
ncbi:MAG TPA: MotA/TolQ/ExbB proton channel family protein [Anaeromyxobacteraceae bacterium]|jgi:biopolymer transport protein ExbB